MALCCFFFLSSFLSVRPRCVHAAQVRADIELAEELQNLSKAGLIQALQDRGISNALGNKESLRGRLLSYLDRRLHDSAEDDAEELAQAVSEARAVEKQGKAEAEG